jgi:hypothetical protein
MGWVAANLQLNSEQKAEECDATDDAQGTEAGIIKNKKFLLENRGIWEENYY